jgi:uncharacterized protein YggE
MLAGSARRGHVFLVISLGAADMRAMLAALAIGFGLSGPVAGQEDTLTVSGTGQVGAPPDMATVRLGVSTDAGTAAEALASNNIAMERVTSHLEAQGVEARDIQTSTLNLGPRYRQRSDGAPEAEGFEARNIVSVRVRELDRLGAILDAVSNDGANTLEGLNFGLSDPQPLSDEALRLAVADARRKAELLASAAEVSLGSVIRLDAGGATPRPASMASARMASESVPVAPGELEVTASVTVVFAIGE